MEIRILVFDGVDELDFVGPYEVFRRAGKLGKDAEVLLVTLTPREEVTAANGLKVRPDAVLSSADLLIVPGGGWAGRAEAGVRAEIEQGQLPARIAELHSRGTVVAGVCTGAMALAAAGLLNDRPATTHERALDGLRSAGASITKARVVDVGDVVTCGGVTSSLDLSLWLVERLWGRDAAESISRQIEYNRSSDVHVSAVPLNR